MKLSWMFTVLAAFLMSASAGATKFEQDSKYIYQVTPWTQALSEEDDVRMLVDASFNVAKNYLHKMALEDEIPKELESLEDLDRLKLANSKIDSALKKLNEWISLQKEEDSSLLKTSNLLPDALMVTFGTKLSANLGIGGGGSIMVGLIVMPVVETRINKVTGEVTSRPSVRVGLVGWGAGDIGPGIGGGHRMRVGMGFIWGSDHFTEPDQFNGFGLGYSQSFSAGIGVNVKAGILTSPQLPGILDFV